MNKEVNFEIAKLLKEKGFDKRTPLVWLFSLGKTHLREIHLSLELNNAEYNAPTIAEVVMWLFEKHGIWTYVHKDGGWWFPVIENYYDEDDQGTIIEDLSKMTKTYFDSLTEAYEAAIEYTLNNLI